MVDEVHTKGDRVRTAEVIAALSLATDLAVGFPLEHGLRSALLAMRLSDRLAIDAETASQAYFISLLFYVGCYAPVDLGWEVFGGDDALTTYATPYRFGTRVEMARGMARAVAPPTGSAPWRAGRVVRRLPEIALAFPSVVAATCEVGKMLSIPLGMSTEVSQLFIFESERWDGKGMPDGVGRESIPLAVRIAHVARDAVFQLTQGDSDFVAEVIARRAGGAFDPEISAALGADAEELLAETQADVWSLVLEVEPKPWLMLEGAEIDDALAAMGHFSDMAVPFMVGHSSGVARICRQSADVLSLGKAEKLNLSRAALLHDLGRVTVPVRIWEKPGQLNTDDWEQVRLHAYQSERLLGRSPFLSRLIPAVGAHHERLDGSGYHRESPASALSPAARLLAAADAYHAMTEPRPHRPALSPGNAAEQLTAEALAGRLAPEAVAAVLEAVGHPGPPVTRPAGLTEREVQVIRLLSHGFMTKQIARSLDISAKTADFHIQNAYRKMGVSTRAGATVFAMQHGIATWENSL